MGETVHECNITRDSDYLYYFKDSSVWRSPRKGKTGKKGVVCKCGVTRDTDYIYYVGKTGNLERSKRAQLKKKK